MRDLTRTEAIELLKSLRFEDDETCSENKAVDMAIASLETDEAYDLMYEQPEFCKDCISRKAVFEIMDDIETAIHDGKGFDYSEWCGKVYELPSVLPKTDVPDINVGKIGSTTKNDLVDDVVRRKAVLNTLDNMDSALDEDDRTVETYKELLKECYKVLPSVTPQELKWIPVSERLPEPYMFVNATCRSLVDSREDWVVETIYLPIPKEHNPRHYSDWGNIPMLNWGEAEVIAWVERTIPQPYRAESEDNK